MNRFPKLMQHIYIKNEWKINQKSIKNLSKIHQKSISEASWGLLGCLGGVLERPEASWGRLGGVLGRLGGVLAASWSVLGASLRRPGASWGRLGGQHGSNLAPKTEPKLIKNRSKKQSKS